MNKKTAGVLILVIFTLIWRRDASAQITPQAAILQMQKGINLGLSLIHI